MQHRIEWRHSAALFVQAHRFLWWRQQAGPWAFYTSGPALVLLLCVTSDELTSSRAGFAAIGFFAGVVATMLGAAAYSYTSLARSKRLRRLGGRALSCAFTEQGIEIVAPSGSGSYKWGSFSRLWRRPEFWVLILDERPVLLPARLLSEEARDFIVSKLTEAGGRVS